MSPQRLITLAAALLAAGAAGAQDRPAPTAANPVAVAPITEPAPEPALEETGPGSPGFEGEGDLPGGTTEPLVLTFRDGATRSYDPSGCRPAEGVCDSSWARAFTVETPAGPLEILIQNLPASFRMLAVTDTGRELDLPGVPVASPDGSRLVASGFLAAPEAGRGGTVQLLTITAHGVDTPLVVEKPGANFVVGGWTEPDRATLTEVAMGAEPGPERPVSLHLTERGWVLETDGATLPLTPQPIGLPAPGRP